MKNAVEKWEGLGVPPPCDVLQVPAVGLSALSHVPPGVEQAAMVDVGVTDTAPQTFVGSQSVPATEAPLPPEGSVRNYRVEAAHHSVPAPSSSASRLSQRLQRVQETCARLLPIKGRSSKTTDTGSQTNWIVRLLFHPEAVVVLLLIVACFLAIVILDNGEDATEDVAAISEVVEAPTKAVEAVSPATQPAPAVPAASVESPAQAATPVQNPPANVDQPTPVAVAPVASEPPPAAPVVPVEQPANPAAGIPHVAQAFPLTEQLPAGAAPPTGTPPAVPTANTPPPVAVIPPAANPQPNQPWIAPSPRMPPPHAASNMPTVIRGRINPLPQQPVASPMFHAPPTGPRALEATAMRPQPYRTLNHTYIPTPPRQGIPTASAQAYPTTLAPELPWQPQRVAVRPPQYRAPHPAAQLRGTIERPLPGTF